MTGTLTYDNERVPARRKIGNTGSRIAPTRRTNAPTLRVPGELPDSEALRREPSVGLRYPQLSVVELAGGRRVHQRARDRRARTHRPERAELVGDKGAVAGAALPRD